MILDIYRIKLDDKILHEFEINNDKNLVLDVGCNYKLFNNNIEILKEFGLNIDTINDIFLYNTDVLFDDLSFIKNKFDDVKKNEIVSIINDDYSEINLIFD